MPKAFSSAATAARGRSRGREELPTPLNPAVFRRTLTPGREECGWREAGAPQESGGLLDIAQPRVTETRPPVAWRTSRSKVAVESAVLGRPGSRVLPRPIDRALNARSTVAGLIGERLGSPSVLATLWEVDDRCTVRLMRGFYERLRQADKATALAATQRAALEGGRPHDHPYFWAPFVLVGRME